MKGLIPGRAADRRSTESQALLKTPSRSELTAATRISLVAAFAAARHDSLPYCHWLVSPVFPPGMAAALRRLPFPRPDLGGISGKRELHNDQRHYFDAIHRLATGRLNRSDLRLKSRNSRSTQSSKTKTVNDII